MMRSNTRAISFAAPMAANRTTRATAWTLVPTEVMSSNKQRALRTKMKAQVVTKVAVKMTGWKEGQTRSNSKDPTCAWRWNRRSPLTMIRVKKMTPAARKQKYC